MRERERKRVEVRARESVVGDVGERIVRACECGIEQRAHAIERERKRE